LDAKVFPDWSALIVATHRAQVNDSEAVDALGKVEILSAIIVRGFQWKTERRMKKVIMHLTHIHGEAGSP
jgi:hypothetical protein